MTSDTSHEIELKCLLPEHGPAALLAHPALQPPRADEATDRDERTVYFDTPDLVLSQHRLALRVRHRGKARVQTLKSAPEHDGAAAARGEWEMAISQDHPDLSLLADTPFAAQLQEVAERLGPVCETRVRRAVRMLRPEGAVVEAALDLGEIRAGDRSLPLRELELELKDGDPAALYRLALELHQTVQFTVGMVSKAGRGMALLTGAAPAASPARDIVLDRDIDAVEGLARLVDAAVGHCLANQEAAYAGDVEGVHQLRVAIRRLRSLLTLFAPWLEPTGAHGFDERLRTLGQQSGAARDWDVFVTETLAAAEQDGLARWTAMLAEPAATARLAAHGALRAALHAPEFTALILAMAAVAASDRGVSPIAPTLHGALRKHTPDMLDRLWNKVTARGAHLAKRSPIELHALRKSVKKLRYGTEFLASLYDGDAVHAIEKACKRLQAELGAINDAASIATQLRLLTQPSLALLAPATVLAHWGSERGAAARAALPDAWQELAEVKPFWR